MWTPSSEALPPNSRVSTRAGQVHYQALRVDARTRLHIQLVGLAARRVGSWFREGVNEVRIRRTNPDNHILGVEGVRHALQAHGERRSLEEDPEPRRHD